MKGNVASCDEVDLIERGREPLLSLPPSMLVALGLSVTRALDAIALAAASAAQSALSRVGDVPATLTKSVATTAGALATDVKDWERWTRLFRFCSDPVVGIATSLAGDRNVVFNRRFSSNLSTESVDSLFSADWH